MSQWYLSYDGNQEGPYDLKQAQERAAANPNGHAWSQDLGDWKPISQVAQLHGGGTASAPAPPVRLGAADEIDYEVKGTEMQFVEVELDPGESAVAEAGSMMYKDSDIVMNTIFGDGSHKAQGGGFMDKLLGAGKRLITGESLFITVFTHQGSGKAKVAFAAPYPGNILPISLPRVDGTLICQKDSFLCAAKGVQIGIYFQKRILTGLFGGEGFIMQKLEGDGLCFVHAGGTLVERQLKDGETLHVDTGCIVAFEKTVDFNIEQVGGVKSMIFGGEGIVFARLRGPGHVWMQSLPFSRLAGRMLAAAPQRGGSRKGEGSVLGGLGDILGGDPY